MTDSYAHDILDRFYQQLEKDKGKYVEEFVVSWAYQDKNKVDRTDEKEKIFYQFESYTGPREIELWWDWAAPDLPCFLFDTYFEDMIERVTRFDTRVARTAGVHYDFQSKRYQRGIARNNAQDYTLMNSYPSNMPQFGRRVLDFGAGYGRQACLWNLLQDEDLVFIGVDGIPKSYCQQHFYYSCFDRPLIDYVVEPDKCVFNELSRGNYHVPTWRLDLIPNSYLDQIMTVQVLPELSEELVTHACRHFHRMLKPGGMLYVRDHKDGWQPVHSLNIDNFLLELGFVKEFELAIEDGSTFHGIPRIFRKLK